ncbi:hypothetical protein C2E23DRAFT_801805 [Lenzites betulinus]|nr:hypothetical protein C2E23DRAFT_801805 [Lenzites betulinus]
MVLLCCNHAGCTVIPAPEPSDSGRATAGVSSGGDTQMVPVTLLLCWATAGFAARSRSIARAVYWYSRGHPASPREASECRARTRIAAGWMEPGGKKRKPGSATATARLGCRPGCSASLSWTSAVRATTPTESRHMRARAAPSWVPRGRGQAVTPSSGGRASIIPRPVPDDLPKGPDSAGGGASQARRGARCVKLARCRYPTLVT